MLSSCSGEMDVAVYQRFGAHPLPLYGWQTAPVLVKNVRLCSAEETKSPTSWMPWGWLLEQELRKWREQHTGGHTSETLLGKTPPQRDARQHVEDIRRELESVKKENDTLRTALEEKSSLSSSLTLSHEDEQEQDQSLCKDAEPSICPMCENQDSLTIPKRECRNCSGVFCENCVANELPLPSSINPEHVCDVCHSQLLQQYASSPS